MPLCTKLFLLTPLARPYAMDCTHFDEVFCESTFCMFTIFTMLRVKRVTFLRHIVLSFISVSGG